MTDASKYYELYRRSSLGSTLTDTLDEFISNGGIEPQLALKILTHFDKAVSDIVAEKVKARMTFKGHLDTYRFCDEVWTFIIKDIALKLDNTNSITADKIKIVTLPADLNRSGQANTDKLLAAVYAFAKATDTN